MRLDRLVFSMVAGLLLAVGAVLATDTGTLIVKTTDRSGSSFPGVVVEILNSKGLTTPKPKQTDASGTASFLLGGGSGYSVKVSGGGMGTQTSDEFKLEMDKTKTIMFTMQDQLVEKVQVKAKVVELDEGGEGKVSFTDNFLEDLPILGRSYQNALVLAPGVNDANNDGNPNVHGARERDFKATVDGVSNVDPLTGTFMSNINPDAIEEIEIVTHGASAEYGGAVGGFGKIITKQGTNAFDGNTSIYIRSSFFDGNTINSGTDAREDVTYHDVRPTLNFTGPIVKDKVFFALFHEYIDRGEPVNLLGGGTIVVDRKGSRNLDKLTWQATPRNKLVFQAQSDPLRIGPLFVTAFTDPDSGADYKQGGPVYQFHWNAQVSSVLNLETLVGMSHTGISIIPNTAGVRNRCGIDEEGAIGGRHDAFGNLGGLRIDEDYCFETRSSRTSGSYLRKYSDDRIRYTLKSDASYFLDNFLGISHTLKAGVLVEKKRFEATDQFRPVSTFTEATASLGGIDEPTRTGGGVLTRLVYVPGLPGIAANKGEGSSFAVYLEDQFRPHNNVSVRVGMRVDQENLKADGFKHFDPAGESSQFQKNYDECLAVNPNNGTVCATSNFHFFHTYEFFPAFGQSEIRGLINDPRLAIQRRETEKIRISNTNIGPRLSLSWDPGTNGKMKIFGTAGRYYGDTFLAIPTFEQPPDTFLFQYEVLPIETCVPEGNGTACTTRAVIGSDADLTTRVNPASIRQVDRNLKTPYNDEFTLGFSREIFQETSITLTWIRRHYRDQFQDIDVNHFAKDQGNSDNGCIRVQNGSLVPIDRRKDGVFDDCGGRLDTIPGPPPFNIPQIIELPDQIPDLYINNPFFNQIQVVGNFNESDYTAYEFEFKRRLHRNWELEASYVWSKAVGSAEDYNLALGNDPTTVQDEFGYLGYDQRHLVKVNVRTQLPLWNVRLSSAFTWESGLPYSITESRTSRDQVRSFGPFNIAYASSRTTFPTHQRNDQRNENFWNFDIGARKDFTVGKTSLEGSLDVLNLLNEDSLIIATVNNDRIIGQRSRGRQFQIGAKMTF